LSNVFRNL